MAVQLVDEKVDERVVQKAVCSVVQTAGDLVVDWAEKRVDDSVEMTVDNLAGPKGLPSAEKLAAQTADYSADLTEG